MRREPPLDPPEDAYSDWCEQWDLDPTADETINEWRGLNTAPDEPEIE